MDEYLWICVILTVVSIFGAAMSRHLRKKQGIDWDLPVYLNGLQLGMTWEEVLVALGEPLTPGEKGRRIPAPTTHEKPWKPTQDLTIYLTPKWEVREVRGTDLLQKGKVLLTIKSARMRDVQAVLGEANYTDGNEDIFYYYFTRTGQWGIKLMTTPPYTKSQFEVYWIALVS